jgi:RNA polymerase sigma factor (sigma-70 family)
VIGRDPLANPEPLIRRIYAYVAYRIGEGPDAEDVTSNTLERALRYRNSFDPRRGDAATWLIGIARRCIDDALVRRSPVLGAGAETTAPGDLEEEVGLRDELRVALCRLDPRDRELIALRFGGDLTAQQIGEALGMTTNAVDVALHRALRRLRVLVEPPDGEVAIGDVRPVRI